MARCKQGDARKCVCWKTHVAIGIAFSLLWLSSAVAAPPRLAIDNPTAGQHVSGLVNILGWAVGVTAPIDYVEVSFDGQSPTPAGYGGARTDVGLAFPDIPDADFSGYALGWNARLLTNGVHRMTVRAVDMNGEAASRSVRFLVSNAPGDENPRKVEIDLSGATLDVVGKTEVLVEGIEIGGQSLTTVLKYDPPSNKLTAISFVADQDDDGVRDDDSDSDGFADTDNDRDGFPDDDLDRNGLSDSLENTNTNTNENTNSNENMNENTNANGNENTNTNTNTNENDNGNDNTNGNANTNTNTNENTNENDNENSNDNDNENDDDDDDDNDDDDDDDDD